MSEVKELMLSIEGLSKSYKEIKAVDNISFEVYKGEFFAFLGPNGAGKSTTIKMITTLLQSDSGTISLNGVQDDIYIRNKIGVVFQENILDNNLTVKENLMMHGALYIASDEELAKRYEQIKEEFSLTEIENQKFKTLSGGQKRRSEIARALIASPEVLLLDEPTTGLDPDSRKMVWEIINDLKNKKGITVILTTHYMEETNDADSIVIINKGKIVAKGTPNELKSKYAHDIFKVVPKDTKRFVNYLKTHSIKNKKIADQFEMRGVSVDETIKILSENQNNIKSYEFIKGSMDDVFVFVVGEKIL